MEQTLGLSRKIVISQPINDGLAGEIIDHITMINDLDKQLTNTIVGYEPEPIEMFINSGGGSATAGFAIIGAMEMSETPIVTYGVGIVASMALGIFIAGDIRIAHRFCRFMYHAVQYGEEGFLQDHIDGIKEVSVIQEMYNSLFLDYTKFSKEKMMEISLKKQNYFFSGKEAVKLGVADDVIKKPEAKVEMITEEEFEALLKSQQE